MALGRVKLGTLQCHQGPRCFIFSYTHVNVKTQPTFQILSIFRALFLPSIWRSPFLIWTHFSCASIYIYIYIFFFFSRNWNRIVHNFLLSVFSKTFIMKMFCVKHKKAVDFIFLSFSLFLLAVRHCMWDLSSQTGDWLPVLYIGNMESLPLDHQEASYFPAFEWLIWNCEKNP